MTDIRQSILRGTDAAARTHHELGSRERWEQHGGRVDVFGAIDHFGLPLMFRPMEGLLGAYIVRPAPGVLVSTQRPLSVRRFTAAHELGHHRLGHGPSVDDEDMIKRTPFAGVYDPQEAEADAFAIAFLVPLWLVSGVMQLRSWKKADMENPVNTYQLALRAGASYEATCYALRNHLVVTDSTCKKLARVQPKDIKQSIVSAFKPNNWRLDVWTLDERDKGLYLELAPNDILDISLAEHSGGGYVWDVAGIAQTEFELVGDRREPSEAGNAVGAHVRRRLTAQARSAGIGSVQFVERRPWERKAPPLNSYQFTYDVREIEKSGLLKAQLERMVGGSE